MKEKNTQVGPKKNKIIKSKKVLEDSDNHLVITWNHSTHTFVVNIVGEATLSEAVGLLEFAKLELMAQNRKTEEEN